MNSLNNEELQLLIDLLKIEQFELNSKMLDNPSDNYLINLAKCQGQLEVIEKLLGKLGTYMENSKAVSDFKWLKNKKKKR